MPDESTGDINESRIEDIKMSVGEGWHKLVLLLNDILNDIDPNYHLAQVKEKFGGLRYYIDTDNELAQRVAYKIIHVFENYSERICEFCGKPGELRNRSWYKTLCDECNGS